MVKEYEKILETILGTKTGSLSVSDPDLGISESPLGDATLLPVLKLEELKYFDAPVSTWVGYNPTNAGFQYLQEAYRNGEWCGRRPHFKLPKAFRDAGAKKISDLKPLKGTNADTGPLKRPRWKHTEQGAPGEPSTAAHSRNVSNESPPNKNATQTGRTFSFTPGLTSNSFQWSTPVTDELIKEVNGLVDQCRNGGRAEAEREFASLSIIMEPTNSYQTESIYQVTTAILIFPMTRLRGM